jgi:hypothetical protein
MKQAIANFFKSRLISSSLKNKSLQQFGQIIIALLVIWIVFTVLYPSKKENRFPVNNEIQELDKSFEKVRKITDPYIRQYTIQKEAKRLQMTTSDYEKLRSFRNKGANVPDAPSDGLIERLAWYFQDLTVKQRFSVSWNFLSWLFQNIPNLAVLFVIIRFIIELPQKERQARYQAWQVVHLAHSQKISGARISALEDLNEQGESFASLILEEDTDLRGIYLENANLIDAKLVGVNFGEAILKRANLENANFENANLGRSQLSNAILIGTNLTKASLGEADLTNANLAHSKLNGAILIRTNFEGANLEEANFTGANLAKANLTKVKNITVDQIKSAIYWQSAIYEPNFRERLGLPQYTPIWMSNLERENDKDQP